MKKQSSDQPSCSRQRISSDTMPSDSGKKRAERTEDFDSGEFNPELNKTQKLIYRMFQYFFSKMDKKGD